MVPAAVVGANVTADVTAAAFAGWFYFGSELLVGIKPLQ